MSTNSWQPNPTWWDVETVLAQDTRDYKYKSIYLLNDSQPAFYTPGDIYATSDGQFYPQGGEHIWDATQDKPCVIDDQIAYSTRYVIVYSNLAQQHVPNGTGAETGSLIGGIVNGYSSMGGFSGQMALEFLKFGAPVTRILSGAFANCPNLRTIDIPEGVQRIESGAFSGCFNLRRVELPSTLTFLGSQAFAYCESLESISIPAGVTAIYQETFAFCSQLVSVSMSQVESVAAVAFSGCKSLRTVYLPNVRTIGTGAFGDCHSLCSLVVGNNPVTVEASNGYNCHSLRSLVFSADVVLKPNAFAQMPQLNHVTFKGNCSITGVGFYGTPSLSRITLPQDFDSSVNFSHATLAPEMMVEMFGRLKDNSPKTLTLGAVNLTKLTDEQKAIATNKNWVLA